MSKQKCESCGTKNHLHLTWKHKTKPKPAGNVFSFSEKKAAQQLKHYKIFCTTCRHDYWGWGKKHGTLQAYKRYKCRCNLCVANKRKYERDYRAKLKRERPHQYKRMMLLEKKRRDLRALTTAQKKKLLTEIAKKAGLI